MRTRYLAVLSLFFSSALTAQELTPDQALLASGVDETELVGTTPFVDGQLLVRFAQPTTTDQARTRLDSARYEFVEPIVPSIDLFLYRIGDGSSVAAAIYALRDDPAVRYAHPDHLVEKRVVTFPNDPNFGSQWNMHNPGGGGGSVDADIDAPEAWDLGTGSDQFVVAIVDGGGQHTHTDLVGNRWTNSAEVGGINGVDDDGNGYVDDRYGWNAYGNNGNIPGDSHGTHVAGIAGARGNNGTGVVGVNWNVDLMWVAASSGSTSVVLKGYNYVLDQKNLWLSSNGTQGANVVAANSSFGIDFANCNQNPYSSWNGLYNQMGNAGILNTGATMNNNSNVDNTGDVPTGCSSNWLITVTNTTKTDVKNGGAAFGQNTIDLGAPGTSIRSTYPTNSYQFLTGTSMAAPHVAGAVAFLHSVASADFAALRDADPAGAALLVKDFILDNVDVLSSLNNKTVSDGRLNLFKSAQAISNFVSGPPPTPEPTITDVSPLLVKSVVVDGPAEVVLTGTNFSTTTKLEVDGVELSNFPPMFSVDSDTQITLSMPQVSKLGSVDIDVTNPAGVATGTIGVIANNPPEIDILNSDPAFLVSASGVTARMAALPGDICFLFLALEDGPSVLPGIYSLDIGNGNTSLFLVFTGVTPAQGYSEISAPFNPLPVGTKLYFQGGVISGILPALPLTSTNVQVGTALF